ncbi:hypothetical protein BGX30_014011 [Mortierella sp. GBA39]|nr:hypothetical protein BGX30_014011 [Mortierella sp. GBA39]
MFAWMTVVLFAMEDNPSGIEEVDTLQRNLQLEIGNRVKESEILIKASFFHPAYNLLYKQCNEENFDVLKDLLRREMQDIAPPINAPVQLAGEKPTATHKLARAKCNGSPTCKTQEQEPTQDKTMKHQQVSSTDISSVVKARITKSTRWIGGGNTTQSFPSWHSWLESIYRSLQHQLHPRECSALQETLSQTNVTD